MGATEIAQSVQYFLHKRENQSPEPWNSQKKQEVAMCACALRAGETETRGSWGLVAS